MKKDFKFALGQTVLVQPVAGHLGIVGKVVSQHRDIDGGLGYTVSALHLGQRVARHLVSEHEVQIYTKTKSLN